MLGVGVSSVPEASHLPSELRPLLCDLVYVRVTSVARYWGFQLAAVAHVGEGRARGQIQTSFPCGCVIWLLRSGMLFCFALFLVCSVCSISVQSGWPGDAEDSSPSLEAQAERLGSCFVTATHRVCCLGSCQGQRACYDFTYWAFPLLQFLQYVL